MKLTSTEFLNKSEIPSLYTCDGQNFNPPLSLSGVPAPAKSLALIVDDPDATVGTWDHWVIWNISPAVAEIAENSVPSGAIVGQNSWSEKKYGGPCPPSGSHRYFFKLYALDTMLNISSDSNVHDLIAAMQNHILTETELMGTYQRK